MRPATQSASGWAGSVALLALLCRCSTPSATRANEPAPALAPQRLAEVTSVLETDLGEATRPAAPLPLESEHQLIRLQVLLRSDVPREAVTQELDLRPLKLGTEPDAVTVELQDLPIALPARHVRKDFWELRLTPNQLQLLARGGTRAVYAGRLRVDAQTRQRFPLELCIERAPPPAERKQAAPAPAPKAPRAPRRKARSAG